MTETERLIVLGAGPKALAIAAKADALGRAGFTVPEVVLVDRAGVAAHWSGSRGYTDGYRRLGTPPEKDVGFPYRSGWGRHSERVTAAVRRFSWEAFLVADDTYSDWVDRGRLRPTHRQWSDYLVWVAANVPAAPVPLDVTGFEVVDDHWRVTGHHPETREPSSVDGDGLVVTGPGPPLPPPGLVEPSPGRKGSLDMLDPPRVLDGHSFWLHTDDFRGAARQEICVVGSGETAGSIATALLDMLPDGSVIEIVNSQGVLYSRGESYAENRYYSRPDEGWRHLAERHRREFLRRTDRGAFSLQVQDVLNRAESVRTVAGRVTEIVPDTDKVTVEITYERECERIVFDTVVVAIGFDPLWFVPLLGSEAAARLAAALGFRDGPPPTARHAYEQAIGTDLSLEGLTPGLHLPALAGVQQGPGFPNLSCLGLLADRVLSSYATCEHGRACVQLEHAERLVT